MGSSYHSVELPFVFDDPAFAGLAVERAAEYQKAQPFPHIAMDQFLPPALATELADAFPVNHQTGWINRDNANNRRRFLQDERKMPEIFRHMCREFNSPQFLLFLETLTGIDNLLPDPYMIAGGLHVSGRGDFLKIHADFNWHHKLQAYRRVNALLYLSRDWQEDWNGALELWNREMTKPVVSLYPLFNRLIVFNVGEHSNHGQPRPNACPEGVYRTVINMYYYTARNTDQGIDEPHFTMYKTDNSPFATELREGYVHAGNAYIRTRQAGTSAGDGAM
jgi:hypothetical protein